MSEELNNEINSEEVTSKPVADKKSTDKNKDGMPSALLYVAVAIVIIAIVVVVASLIITSSMKKKGRVGQDAGVIESVKAFFAGEEKPEDTPDSKGNTTTNNDPIVIDADITDTPSVNTETDPGTADTQTQTAPVFNVKTTLGQYKGITVDFDDVSVSDEEVDMEIDIFCEDNATEIPVEDTLYACEIGDTVDVDFAGSIDGVAFDGGTGNVPDLKLGSGSMIPGFEEAIAGHHLGESFDINVTFPEDYHSTDLAGKDAVFAIKINAISLVDIPDFTDELVAENSEYETAEEYRQYVHDFILDNKLDSAKNNAESDILMAAINNATFEGDIDSEIEFTLQQSLEYYDSMASSMYGEGMDGATLFLYMYGMSNEQYMAMMSEQATYTTKLSHILDEVAIAENIQIDDEKFRDKFAEIFYDTYGFETEEDVYTQISKEEAEKFVNDSILQDEAEEIILGSAVINGKPEFIE